jgi:hypothetical protein
VLNTITYSILLASLIFLCKERILSLSNRAAPLAATLAGMVPRVASANARFGRPSNLRNCRLQALNRDRLSKTLLRSVREGDGLKASFFEA